MHLIQIFLPVPAASPGGFRQQLDALKMELAARFGGVTVFRQSPAEGLWRDGGEVVRDEIVVVEVMAEALDADWWRNLRRRLEHHLEQQEIVIRTFAIQRL